MVVLDPPAGGTSTMRLDGNEEDRLDSVSMGE
jgi:hypothetical protein